MTDRDDSSQKALTVKPENVAMVVLEIVEIVIFYFAGGKDIALNTMLGPQGGNIADIVKFIVPAGFMLPINKLIAKLLAKPVGNLWDKLCLLFGIYKKIQKKFKTALQAHENWLMGLHVHWAPHDGSQAKRQNANTAETLIAFQKSGLFVKNKMHLMGPLKYIDKSASVLGLKSKSLDRETTSCTSMMLYLMALLGQDAEGANKDQLGQKFDKYNKIAQNLWKARSDGGWGIFVQRTEEENCSNTYSFFALRALNYYAPCPRKDYIEYVRGFYERAQNGCFGFSNQDEDRMMPTALGIILYYELEKKERSEIQNADYDVGMAVEYVFNQFVEQKIDYELETINGLKENDDETPGARVTTWHHVVIAYVVEALVYAYSNGNLKNSQMKKLMERIASILDEQVTFINGHEAYYMPRGMQRNQAGTQTFPSAYMMIALSTLVNGVDRIFTKEFPGEAEFEKIKRISDIGEASNYQNEDVLLLPKGCVCRLRPDYTVELENAPENLNNRQSDLTRIRIKDKETGEYKQSNILTPCIYAESLENIPYHLVTQGILMTTITSQNTIDWIKEQNEKNEYGKHDMDQFWISKNKKLDSLKTGDMVYICNRRVGGWDGSPDSPVIELLGTGGHMPVTYFKNKDGGKFAETDIKTNVQKEAWEEIGIHLQDKDVAYIGWYVNESTHEVVTLSLVTIEDKYLPTIYDYALSNYDADSMGIYLGDFKETISQYQQDAQFFAGGESKKPDNFPSKKDIMDLVNSAYDKRAEINRNQFMQRKR